jgi:hypothetical protein
MKVQDPWDDERVEKWIARNVSGVEEGEEQEVLEYLNEVRYDPVGDGQITGLEDLLQQLRPFSISHASDSHSSVLDTLYE